MAYMYSNEPYQRIRTDSAWNGMAIGSAVGLAGAAATDFGLSRMRQYGPGATMTTNLGNVTISPEALKGLSSNDRKAMGVNQMESAELPTRARRAHQQMFGSGWRRAASYGVAGIGGALIGGATDSLN